MSLFESPTPSGVLSEGIFYSLNHFIPTGETGKPAALALSLNAPLLGRGVCVALRVPAPGFKQLRYAPAPLGAGLRLLVGLGNIPSFALLLSAPLRLWRFHPRVTFHLQEQTNPQ